MLRTSKVLGQVAADATTLTTLYTVPLQAQAEIKTLVICNRSSATTFRVAIQPKGVTVAVEHYIAYDSPIGANDTIILEGFEMSASDIISVYAGAATLTFSVFGAELRG
jgi:hypothetical protein